MSSTRTTNTITVNGRPHPIDDVSPATMLLHLLRARGLVGTKEGCAEGDCGACTVALVAGAAGGARYRAINSCLVPIGALAGREVVTVEGVAPGVGDALHPVQQALVDSGGSQCGYCTPGFVMSLFSAYYDGDPGDAAIEGNLCRCTGYLPIRRAAGSLRAPTDDDPHVLRLNEPRPAQPARVLEHPDTTFHRPSSLAAALELLARHPEGRLIAGGTDLGVEMNKFGKRFPVLVSLEGVADLQGIDDAPDAVTIGAGVPLRHLEESLAGVLPALDDMLVWFAARQIRNRATLGGNLGTASPIGDLLPVLLALDAEVRLAGLEGERTVNVADFFTGYRETVLRPGEIIVAVRIPKGPADGATRRLSRSYKVGKRGTDDISIVAASYTLDLDDAGTVRRARLAYGGVAAVPLRAVEVETWLTGRPWDEAAAREAARRLAGVFSPLSDHRGSAAYRRRLSGNLLLRFFDDTPVGAAA